jgi:hypothetical protein
MGNQILLDIKLSEIRFAGFDNTGESEPTGA